jgi:hypothetical protein
MNMKGYLFKIALLLALSTFKGYAQYKLKTEVQSTFIDITGLFGVNEPASITQFTYTNKGFGLDLYHGFSLQNFGKSIQTIITPSYTFKLDQQGKFFLKPKAEIAHLELSGGGFIRPGYHFIYKPNAKNIFNLGNWGFIDLRDQAKYPKRLNGYTFLLSYTHYDDFGKWRLTEEARVLFVDILETLKVSGAFGNIQLTYQPLGVFVGANAVYTYYRSDNKNELFWNIAVGKQF